MRTSNWKRLLSLVLALALMAPMVLDVLSGVGITVTAAENDAGGIGAGIAGKLINGVYEIRVPGTDLNVGYQAATTASIPALYLFDRNKTTTTTNAMRWAVEYGGMSDLDGDGNSESHWYTLRNLDSGRMMWQDPNGFIKVYNNTRTADGNSEWNLVYNTETDTYTIRCWDKCVNGVAGYMTPVIKSGDSVEQITREGSYVRAMELPFAWELERVSVQDYTDDTKLAAGNYRIQTYDGAYQWSSTTNSADYGVRLTSGAAGTNYGSQTWVVDWTSDGYVTFFDNYTGKYIGDTNGHTKSYSGALSSVETANTHYADQLRYKWVPVPVHTILNESATQSVLVAGQYYLCNALTGRCLYTTPSILLSLENIQVGLASQYPWYFKAVSVSELRSESTSQGHNGTTGIYMDSFDAAESVKLPIKIYDYVNDGILFEYAQDPSTSATRTSSSTGKVYVMGNNTGFTFQSGSRGGSTSYWYGSTNGYYAGKNEGGSWNTYKTFLLPRVYYMDNSIGPDWYTKDGELNLGSRYDYYWEGYGLTDFRGLGTAGPKWQSSVYLLYNISDSLKMGLGKYPTTGADGTNRGTFNTPLQSGDTYYDWNTGSWGYTGDPYYLYGTIGGVISVGLVQPYLNELTNAPEYRDIVVEYLADMLSKTLRIPETNPSNSSQYAYNYVAGAKHDRYIHSNGTERDLATWLRARLGSQSWNMGSYEQSYAKRESLIGTWAECKDNIVTVCDAAYFLLNNLFVPGSYNEEQNMFDYLELKSVKVDDAEGNIVDAYVFDSGFTTGGTSTQSSSAVLYDTENRVITNSNVTGKALTFLDDDNNACAHPFLPVWESYDMTTKTGVQDGTKSPYVFDSGVTSTSTTGATYVNRNYNYVLASNGEFLYSYNDELFFNFDGDDDVYLYINGQLVLDIGGAHAISSFNINLNDYVDAAREEVARLGDKASDRAKALALEEGAIYSFDFYYMERHGWGSNMRIVTNIRVTERDMAVQKDAAQNGVDLDPNDIIDPDAPVEYSFTLSNTGGSNLIHPVFTDSNIGVVISFETGLTVTGSNVFDKDGEALDASDLVLTYYNPLTRSTTKRTFANNDELKKYLTDELIIESLNGIKPPFGSLTVSGIYYTLSDEQAENGIFFNTLNATAKIRDDVTSQKQTNVRASDTPAALTPAVTVTPGTDRAGVEILLTNGTADPLIHPTITDSTHGITINPDTGFRNTGSAVDKNGEALGLEDLIFTYTDPSGSVTVKTFVSNEDLQNYLQTELVIQPGGSLTVSGIYDPSPDGTETSVTAEGYPRSPTSKGSVNVTTGETMEDSSDFTVFTPRSPHYYHWRSNTLEITSSILQADITPDVELTARAWMEPTITAINSLAVVDENGDPSDTTELWVENGNVYAKYDTTGTKDVYLSISFTYLNTSSGATKTAADIVPITIYVLDVTNETLVLDYGLQVQVSEEALFGDDVTTVDGRALTTEVVGITTEATAPSYASNNISFDLLKSGSDTAWNITNTASDTYDGSFAMTPYGGDMTYTPAEFLEGEDILYVAIRVRETGYVGSGDLGDVDIRKEVEMYKAIKVLPATVMYYEDDYPALNYTKNDSNADSFVHTGSSSNLFQSAGQEMEYGQDPTYQAGSSAQTSAGSLTSIAIHGLAVDSEGVIHTGSHELLSFTFTGTGFELIAQTNAVDSGSLMVRVTDSGGTSKNIPVITEFDTGADGGSEAIKQVPVVRFTAMDLPADTYTVTVKGMPSYIYCRGEITAETVTEATCLTGAVNRHECVGCGQTWNVTTPAAGHRFTGGSCTACGAKAAGADNGCAHSYASTGTTAPTCTNVGYTAYTCSLCGDSYLGGYVAAPGHRYVGSACSVCGEARVSAYHYAITGVRETYLYMDGLRIFQPLGATHSDYIAEENGAIFTELHNEILNGKVASVTYAASAGLILSSGTTTWTENRVGLEDGTVTDRDKNLQYDKNYVVNADSYLMAGPNNEVYMSGGQVVVKVQAADGTVEEQVMDSTALAFYVSEVGTGEHNLQIAVRALDAGAYLGTGSTAPNARILYGVSDGNGGYAWKELATVVSGTEQYYTIPYNDETNPCPKDADGRYQIVLRVDGDSSAMISYTSLKYNGLELSTVTGDGMDATTLTYDENGLLVKDITSGGASGTSAVANLFMLTGQMRSQVLLGAPEITDPEPNDPEITNPEVTDPEVIEPETTEPEVTEPETTEPEATEPEVIEPETTHPEITDPEVTDPEGTEPEATEPVIPTLPETPDDPTEPDAEVGTDGSADRNESGAVADPEATTPGDTGEAIPGTNDLGLLTLVVLMAAAVTLGCLKRKQF